MFDAAEFQVTFAELVKWHQDLINSSIILGIIYSKSTLFNFLPSSLVICLTGFNVTIVDDIVVIITFLTFLFMGLLQVLLLCFFADMLMSASMDVSSAVYNCHWYYANVEAGKQLLLVQTRAQGPCKLTAAGFADVNLRAFMRVLYNLVVLRVTANGVWEISCLGTLSSTPYSVLSFWVLTASRR